MISSTCLTARRGGGIAAIARIGRVCSNAGVWGLRAKHVEKPLPYGVAQLLVHYPGSVPLRPLLRISHGPEHGVIRWLDETDMLEDSAHEGRIVSASALATVWELNVCVEQSTEAEVVVADLTPRRPAIGIQVMGHSQAEVSVMHFDDIPNESPLTPRPRGFPFDAVRHFLCPPHEIRTHGAPMNLGAALEPYQDPQPLNSETTDGRMRLPPARGSATGVGRPRVDPSPPEARP